jgi:hypothetical protein
LILGKKKSYFILFILEIGSLEEIVDCIVKGGGIVLEGIILLNIDGKEKSLREEILIDLRYIYPS